MAESLESFKSYIGKSEKATDVVTASAMLKFAATLGQENPPMDKGQPIPAGMVRRVFPGIAPALPDASRRSGIWRRHRAAHSFTAPPHRRYPCDV